MTDQIVPDGAPAEDLDLVDFDEEFIVVDEDSEKRGADLRTLTALDYMGNVYASCRQKATEVYEYAKSKGKTLTHIWGYDPNVSNTEHHSGYAADFMVFSDRAAGDLIADYLIQNGKRLGVRHLIWRQRIYSFYVEPGVWRDMADRGNPTANHMDHVHVLFVNSAYVAPTPTPVKPVPAPSTTDPAKVRSFQNMLELTADGKWGASTDEWALRMRTAAQVHLGYPTKRVADFREDLVQRVLNVTVDNIFGPKSIAALIPWVARLQRLLGVSPDGVWGPATDKAFLTFRSRNLNKF